MQNETSNNIIETIESWEGRLALEKKISVEGQDELRGLLKTISSDQSSLRERLVEMLNPRKAKVIFVRDELFPSTYCPLREDNFAPIEGALDRHAYFDAKHGYYVAKQIELLDER